MNQPQQNHLFKHTPVEAIGLGAKMHFTGTKYSS